jgi:molybdopterin converting factor small subunit
MTQQTATLELRIHAGGKPEQRRYQVAVGQTILAAIQGLDGLPQTALVAVVNGITSDMTYTLQPGDNVLLLPQIAGGD